MLLLNKVTWAVPWMTGVFFCCSNIVSAQNDTLTVPLNHPFNVEMVDHTLADAAGVWVRPIGRFSRTTFWGNIENGNFRHPQDAAAIYKGGLLTYGLKDFKKWTLYGKFAYTRSFADSLAWDLSDSRNNDFPYYFATPKPGNWDKEKYELRGLAAFRFSEKISSGLSMEYKTGNAARTNDPRPSLALHQINIEPFFRFSFGKTGIAVSGVYGYGSESSGIIYMNEAKNDIPSALEYTTYEVLGYGNIRNSEKYHRTFQNKNNKVGFSLQLDLNLQPYRLWARAGYMQSNDTLLRNIDNYRNNENIIGRYKKHTTSIMAGLQTNTQRGTAWKALTYYKQQFAKDALFVAIAGLNNYIYQANEAALFITATRYHSARNTTDLGISVQYKSEQKKDGIAQHRFFRNSVAGKCLIGKTFASQKKGQWITQASPAFQLNTASLNFPETQANAYTNHIAIPETAFYNSNNIALQLRGGYGLYLSKKHFASLIFDYNIVKALKNLQHYRNVYALHLNFDF